MLEPLFVQYNVYLRHMAFENRRSRFKYSTVLMTSDNFQSLTCNTSEQIAISVNVAGQTDVCSLSHERTLLNYGPQVQTEWVYHALHNSAKFIMYIASILNM